MFSFSGGRGRRRPTYRLESGGAAGSLWGLTVRGRAQASNTVTESEACWGTSYGGVEYQEVQDWQDDVETHKQAVAPENDQILKQESLGLAVKVD